MTHDHAGVPLLLVRRGDGSLGAYLNVCRHRGARLAEGCGSGARTFSCPYHGWTYGAEGGLLTRPEEGAFTPADKAMHGLRPVPVVETHGIIWLAPSPATRFDGTTLLDGLESEFESYGFAAYHHYETRLLRRPINWKLAVDTFLEGYHIGVLHTKTIAQILHSNRVTFDRFGRNLRLIIPRRSIALLRRLPEADWDLVSHSAIVYLLFPNTVVIVAGDHLETWHVFPAGNGIDECAMRVTLYTPEPAVTASAKGHWDRNFDLLMATVENEDFPLSEGIQRGFYSGAQAEIVFGRNEPALQHFHRSVKAALAAAG
jgi:phenylpropionate dioxygenase-like ring-hydroxylating dioxygenase large terminal subunit